MSLLRVTRGEGWEKGEGGSHHVLLTEIAREVEACMGKDIKTENVGKNDDFQGLAGTEPDEVIDPNNIKKFISDKADKMLEDRVQGSDL